MPKSRRQARRALLVAALLLAGPALAGRQIVVLGLFPNKALVEVDGSRRVIKVGEPLRDGLLLVSADSREAVIEVDGQRNTYTLGGRIGGQFAAPQVKEAQILRDTAGSYRTVGSINGRTVSFVVDTGASAIAMNEQQARRLGLSYRLDGAKARVNTASGVAGGYALELDRVQVGELTLRNVPALVIRGDSPREVLLGMSFLKRVEMRNEGNMLVLRATQ